MAIYLLALPAPAGILGDQTGLAWASYRDLSNAAFASRFLELSGQGFIITDVDGYGPANSLRYSMIWQANVDRRRWAEWRNLTSAQYLEKWREYRDAGYRPLDVEAYAVGNGLRYAGIWVENREGWGWYSYRNLTSQRYGEIFDERRAEGYRPVDIEAYRTSSGVRYAVIWYRNVSGIGWLQLRDMSRARYQQEVTAQAARGYRVIDYESYSTPGGQRYAAIWEQNTAGRGWAMRSDRTETEFANYWREYRDKGYRLVDFERYETPGGTRYAGLWYENVPARLRYTRKGALDAAVENYRTATNVPGISVAVVRDGTMIYRRGFGWADVQRDKRAHGGTVYLAASVSKVVGGTLAAKLEASGQLADGTPVALDLAQPTSTYLSDIPFLFFEVDLPPHHTHTVDQLLSHTACIWHYDTGPEPPQRFYPTSLLATLYLMAEPLLPGCNVGASYNYSTHGFTFAAASIERAAGRPMDRLIEEEIAAPNGLSSMRVQFSDSTLPPNYDRAVPYPAGFTIGSTNYEDNSWKVLGGGIEVSAVDLARFGWRTLNGQIVDAATRDNRLWTPVVAGQNIGLAWALRTRSGRRVAEHGGSWVGARSYLRVYRDNGLVVAILSNRSDHEPGDLATMIADLVLAP